jgi:2-iminobutanoate/2-iminopropanoate deaminase
MFRALSSDKLPQPRFRYSQCIQAGSYYQIAGLVALDPVTGRLEVGGPGAEARKILGNLVAALPDFSLKLGDMVIARIFTTRFDRFGDINAAWDEVFAPPAPAPARTSVGVDALPLGATVEMEFGFYKES